MENMMDKAMSLEKERLLPDGSLMKYTDMKKEPIKVVIEKTDKDDRVKKAVCIIPKTEWHPKEPLRIIPEIIWEETEGFSVEELDDFDAIIRFVCLEEFLPDDKSVSLSKIIPMVENSPDEATMSNSGNRVEE